MLPSAHTEAVLITYITSRRMKKLLRYLFVICAVSFSVVSCADPADPVVPDQESVVPEGTLRIFADKTEISADGADCVTFKVMFGSEDVSSKKTMYLVKESDGRKEEMENGANVFSTVAPGTYKFTAYLYSGGEHFSDNEIVVTAAPVQGQMEYMKKILAEQYTSTGCVNCPGLSANIKQLQKDMPDVLVPVSFHMDFSSTEDPMAVDATAAFMKYHGFQGLPYFNLNFHKASGVETFLTTMADAVSDELNNNPATCGVAIETSYDETSGEAVVKTRITSNLPMRYKYHVFLVEDGLDHAQLGADMTYVHDNVVRKMLAPDVTGFNINKKQPFTPGVEVAIENRVDISREWDPANMRVVVAALISNDGEMTWICANVNECRLGESVDYMIK